MRDRGVSWAGRTAQPERYTQDIVKQIHATVGVAETGVADAAFVQAVAVWQRDNGDLDPTTVFVGLADDGDVRSVARTRPVTFRTSRAVRARRACRSRSRVTRAQDGS